MSNNENQLVLATDALLSQYPKPEIKTISINSKEDIAINMEYIKELTLYKGSTTKGMDTILKPSIERLENLKKEAKLVKEKIDLAKNYIYSRLSLTEVDATIDRVKKEISIFQTKERQELARAKTEEEAKLKAELEARVSEKLDEAKTTQEEELVKAVSAIAKNEIDSSLDMEYRHQATIKDGTGFTVKTRKQWKLDEESVDMLEYIKWVSENPQYIGTLSLNKSECNKHFKPTEAKPNPPKPSGLVYVEDTIVNL